MGIAGFSIDVDGSSSVIGTVTALRAASFPLTNQTSNPPYSQFRSVGTLSSPNLTGISAFQDSFGAFVNNDPTELRFGDGNAGTVHSATYGDIAGNGPLVLATGRWTGSGVGGSLEAVLTPNTVFSLFPLNYAVDDGTGEFNPPPAGTTQSFVTATAVIPSLVLIPPTDPEPSSIVLMGIAAVGLGVFTFIRSRSATAGADPA
jgi:hypothetical protein